MVDAYADSTKYSLYLYLLSESHKKMNNYLESINISKTLVSLGKDVSFYNQALISISELYLSLALESEAIPFLNLLLSSRLSS